MTLNDFDLVNPSLGTVIVGVNVEARLREGFLLVVAS